MKFIVTYQVVSTVTIEGDKPYQSTAQATHTQQDIHNIENLIMFLNDLNKKGYTLVNVSQSG